MKEDSTDDSDKGIEDGYNNRSGNGCGCSLVLIVGDCGVENTL
jgi:hypothetical protein